jgi:hypothetical protein
MTAQIVMAAQTGSGLYLRRDGREWGGQPRSWLSSPSPSTRIVVAHWVDHANPSPSAASWQWAMVSILSVQRRYYAPLICSPRRFRATYEELRSSGIGANWCRSAPHQIANCAHTPAARITHRRRKR